MPASVVGTYDITATPYTPLFRSGNYTFTLNTGKLTISKATLTVTPADTSREYGDPNPSFNGTLTGVKNADAITATYASAATPASGVGTYDITATLQDPTSKLGNYTVTLNTGKLTISQPPLTVTPA